jgi:phosphoribosyl 1,2-cyclic phosphodiesterase
VRVTIWGSRGSIASAGPDTVRYGGNTSCLEIVAADGTRLILDAGTGLRRLGVSLEGDAHVAHLLLTHLHLDHIIGLGFFRPFFDPEAELHVWGPPSTNLDLRTRLTRYLSPPLFPVRLRDLDSHLELHDVPMKTWAIGPFTVTADLVVHPGPTVGYRISEGSASIAYLPDHEPALGGLDGEPEWTSGWALARGADVLFHDAQFTPAEYDGRVGWGHSTMDHAVKFAQLAEVGRLVTFHHDPAHADATLDRLVEQAQQKAPHVDISAGCEGMVYELEPRELTAATAETNAPLSR